MVRGALLGIVIAAPVLLTAGCASAERGGAAGSPTGDPTLAGWPAPRPWSPPFSVLARRETASLLTWRYDPAGAPLPEEAVRAAIGRATAEWERTGAVHFVEAADGSEGADVTISFQRGEHAGCPPFLGWDGGLAHATDPSVMGPGFIHIHAEVDFAESALPRAAHSGAAGRGVRLRHPERVDLAGVILHELGHTLGLGHSADPEAAMAELYRETPAAVTPSDAAGLHSLYGGGLDASSDLAICAIGADGGVALIAPTLRRVSPPEITRWDILDVDGDGAEEILVWPATADPDRIAPLGAGLVILHFGKGALLERTEGPALGILDPERALYFPDAAPGAPARVIQSVGDSLRILSFSATGLPLVPAPPDEEPGPPPSGRTAGWFHPFPRPGGAGERLLASPPDRRALCDFGWGMPGSPDAPPTAFRALDARLGDLDGDGIPELIVQGLAR